MISRFNIIKRLHFGESKDLHAAMKISWFPNCVRIFFPNSRLDNQNYQSILHHCGVNFYCKSPSGCKYSIISNTHQMTDYQVTTASENERERESGQSGGWHHETRYGSEWTHDLFIYFYFFLSQVCTLLFIISLFITYIFSFLTRKEKEIGREKCMERPLKTTSKKFYYSS